ncbi:GGDEF domain-containing protein [Dactylosporangium sp. NPDC048998]|uniref:GGDEF domain-containing protein n=1 Tax=Dactylosporangium sp. NPDC048998 TaxID=3363976 RepID=UPI0037129F9D
MSPILQSVLTAAGGVLAGLAAAVLPLWALARALRIARHQAGHDDTTGLPNRRALVTALRSAVAERRPFGLILLDLDQFKAVNDTYGHEAGNDLLTIVGQRLTTLPVPARLAARLSGDEFAVLVHGDPDQVGAAAQLAASVIESEPAAVSDGVAVTVRASVGYTTSRLGVPAWTLLREADEAMYHAKGHRVGVSRYHPTSAATVMRFDGHPQAQRCRDRR